MGLSRPDTEVPRASCSAICSYGLNEVLIEMLIVDTKSIIVVLILGNLALGTLVMIYTLFSRAGRSSRAMFFYFPSKYFQFAGFLLILLRGGLSNVISVNIGNSILITGFMLESLAMLEIAAGKRKKLFFIQYSITVAAIVFFNVVAVFF